MGFSVAVWKQSSSERSRIFGFYHVKVALSTLPPSHGETSRGPSFAGTTAQTPGPVPSSAGLRPYRRRVRPASAWLGLETTGRRSRRQTAIPKAIALFGSRDAIAANLLGSLRGEHTVITPGPLPSLPIPPRPGTHLRCRRPPQGSPGSIADQRQISRRCRLHRVQVFCRRSSCTTRVPVTHCPRSLSGVQICTWLTRSSAAALAAADARASSAS